MLTAGAGQPNDWVMYGKGGDRFFRGVAAPGPDGIFPQRTKGGHRIPAPDEDGFRTAEGILSSVWAMLLWWVSNA